MARKAEQVGIDLNRFTASGEVRTKPTKVSDEELVPKRRFFNVRHPARRGRRDKDTKKL